LDDGAHQQAREVALGGDEQPLVSAHHVDVVAAVPRSAVERIVRRARAVIGAAPACRPAILSLRRSQEREQRPRWQPENLLEGAHRPHRAPASRHSVPLLPETQARHPDIDPASGQVRTQPLE